jgi:hypothetical protein
LGFQQSSPAGAGERADLVREPERLLQGPALEDADDQPRRERIAGAGVNDLD